jgi:hypothetical protein
MKKLTIKAIIFGAIVLNNAAHADVSLDDLMSDGVDYESETTKTVTTKAITIPLLNKTKSSIKRPMRTESEKLVMTEYGSPIKKHSAKGKPPITRWDYPGFSVYFESGYVLHSVVRDNLVRDNL